MKSLKPNVAIDATTTTTTTIKPATHARTRDNGPSGVLPYLYIYMYSKFANVYSLIITIFYSRILTLIIIKRNKYHMCRLD